MGKVHLFTIKCPLCSYKAVDGAELRNHKLTWHADYRTERDPVFSTKPGWSRYHYRIPDVQGIVKPPKR